MKIKTFICIIVILILLTNIFGCSSNTKNGEKNEAKKTEEPIVALEDGLFPLLLKPMDNKLSSDLFETVEINLIENKKFPDKGTIYKVKKFDYSKEDFYNLAKYLKVKNEFKTIESDLEIRENGYICKSNDKGLTFNKDTGKIEFIDLMITTPITEKLSNDEYNKISEDLLKNNNLSYDNMEYTGAIESTFADSTIDGKTVSQPYIIENTYISTPYNNIENQTSQIRVDFNNRGEICGFMYHIRELEDFETYPLCNKDELIKEIKKGNILGNSELNYKNIEVVDFELVLYVDISKDNLEYITPYYRLTTNINNSEVQLLTRAVKPDHIRDIEETETYAN